MVPSFCQGSSLQSTVSHLDQLNSPVVLAALSGGVWARRLAGAEPLGSEPPGVDRVRRHEILLHGGGALLGERLVRRVAPDVVGVPLNRELQVGVLREHAADLL